MKTLITIAALIAGMAVANAQSNMGSSTSLSCKFASQADCQKESKGKGTCIQNKGTTGSGMSTKTDKKQ